jgi:hypothetical protein
MRFSEFDFDVITSPEKEPGPLRRGNPVGERALSSAQPQLRREADQGRSEEIKPQE